MQSRSKRDHSKATDLPVHTTRSEHSVDSDSDSDSDSETEEVAKRTTSTIPPATVPARGSPVALPSRFGSPQSPTNATHNQFQEPLKLAKQLTFLLERLSKHTEQSSSINKVLSSLKNKELKEVTSRSESVLLPKIEENRPPIPRQLLKISREPPRLTASSKELHKHGNPIDLKKPEGPLDVKTPKTPLDAKIPAISKIPILEEDEEGNLEDKVRVADTKLPITAPNLSLLLANHAFKDTPEDTSIKHPVDSWLGRIEKPKGSRVPIHPLDKEKPVPNKPYETQVITMSQVQACSTPVTTKPRNVEIIDSTFSPIPMENARNISPLTTRTPFTTRSRRFSDSYVVKDREDIFLLPDIVETHGKIFPDEMSCSMYVTNSHISIVIPPAEELRKDSFFLPPKDLKLLSRAEKMQRFVEITEREQWDKLWIGE
ncbi:hypothetical protein TWF694_009610 [Orbilia ellipsospora]|uniref:Uncharacterized protein n=1 Tax=Orbilia ellipsospora TaxID=2528407 RepID=A0AAV9XCD2_9PEZI